MLRLHFTSTDIARTRIATSADPLWELSLSIHALRLRGSDASLAGWKARTSHLLRPGTKLRGEAALALAVNPPLGYFPDFLTPAEAGHGLDAGLHAVLSTPLGRLRREMHLFGQAHPHNGRQVRELAHGRAADLHTLVTGLRAYQAAVIDPIWRQVLAACDADRAVKAGVMAKGGAEALLNRLHPRTRFVGGVLEIPNYTAERDVYLDGRGLLLIPSYFKRGDKPLALVDPELPPVLVFPIDRTVRAVADRRHAGLAELLGRTRATLLECVKDGGGTTQLASRSGVSVSTASQHLAVLRRSGLITGVRTGNTVWHTLTPLGRALLLGQ